MPKIIELNGQSVSDSDAILLEVQLKKQRTANSFQVGVRKKYLDVQYKFENENGPDAEQNKVDHMLTFVDTLGFRVADVLFQSEMVSIQIQPSDTLADFKLEVSKKLNISAQKFHILAREKLVTQNELDYTCSKIATASFYEMAPNLKLALRQRITISELKAQITAQIGLPATEQVLFFPQKRFNDNTWTLQECNIELEKYHDGKDEVFTVKTAVRSRKPISKLCKELIFSKVALGVLKEGIPIEYAGPSTVNSPAKKFSSLKISIGNSSNRNKYRETLCNLLRRFEKAVCMKVTLECDKFQASLLNCSFTEKINSNGLHSLPTLLVEDRNSNAWIELYSATLENHQGLLFALRCISSVLEETLGLHFRDSEGL